MPGDPRLRASDANRERTAELLREHHAVGRLTAEEFEARLSKVFAAKTIGELDDLLADMPAIDLYQLPSAGIRPAPRRGSGLERRGGGNVPGRTAARAGPAAAIVATVGVSVGVAALFGGAAWAVGLVIGIVLVCLVIAVRRLR